MNFILYLATCTGNPKNSFYPKRVKITNKDQMVQAVSFDHVCAEFNHNQRSSSNYLVGNVDVLDCDNEHSDRKEDWVYPEMYDKIFPGVAYVVVPSRSNGKVKGTKSARPRHHIYFPHKEIHNDKECANLKRSIYEKAPFLDGNAIDAARFIYGSTPSDILWHEGEKDIIDFITEEAFQFFDDESEKIHEGSRNSTMSRIAGCIVKRYGNSEIAYNKFIEKSSLCNPPLPYEELELIWKSAVKFGEKVAHQEGYVSPEEFNMGYSFKPDDFSDIGQAKVLAREYNSELVYTDATDYMRYDGTHWVESKQLAVGTCEEFLDFQLEEAEAALKKSKEALVLSGIDKEIVDEGGKNLEKVIDAFTESTYAQYMNALTYKKFVMKRRDMKYVMSALQAAKPMFLKKITDFDSQEFLLNTPGGTFDLRDGNKKEHTADDLITKITSVGPDNIHMDLWLDAVNSFFCGDEQLIRYVQKIVGLAAVGKVYNEALIIAYGEGRNGKSTFWNVISKVLGSYSGMMSADALTVGCKRNVKPEMAEIKGKRLVIAAELEEGMRLNTSIVKQLCSTDKVKAEKKYKDPFEYVPTHTLVLYTNHLPKVGANDDGTWRRLIVIPFNAKIKKNNDIKNYADYLFENAGGAILSWIIEGAKCAIDEEFKFEQPLVVEEAIEKYRGNNDWLSIFMNDCCDLGDEFIQKSGELYQEYRSYCARTGEYTRSTSDFYAALENAGYSRVKKKTGMLVLGMKLKTDFLEE